MSDFRMGKSVFSDFRRVGERKLSRPRGRVPSVGREREVLWLISSLGGATQRRLKEFLPSRDVEIDIARLYEKKLIEHDGKQHYDVTPRGRRVLTHYSKRGELWSSNHIPKIKSKYRVVGFDLDDTLIPGYVNKDVDVNIMRRFLLTLRENGIKVAVLSINPPSTVVERLSQWGLLECVDFPIYTEKGRGLKELISATRYKPSQVMFIGHDVASDYNSVRSISKDVKIALLSDSLSYADGAAYEGDIKDKDDNLVVIDRTFDNLIRLVQGEKTPEPVIKRTVRKVTVQKKSEENINKGVSLYDWRWE